MNEGLCSDKSLFPKTSHRPDLSCRLQLPNAGLKQPPFPTSIWLAPGFPTRFCASYLLRVLLPVSGWVHPFFVTPQHKHWMYFAVARKASSPRLMFPSMGRAFHYHNTAGLPSSHSLLPWEMEQLGVDLLLLSFGGANWPQSGHSSCFPNAIRGTRCHYLERLVCPALPVPGCINLPHSTRLHYQFNQY